MDDNQLVKVEGDNEVQALTKRADEAVSYAEKLEIVDEATLKGSVDARAYISELIKQTDARRKFFVDPYKALAKRIDAFFAPVDQKLCDAKIVIGRKQVAYDNEQTRKANEAKEAALKKLQADQAKADAAVAAGKITQEQADAKNTKSLEKAVSKIEDVVVPQKTVRSDTGASLSFRTTLKVVVVDEALVPKQYCTPDPKKYKDIAIALHKGKQEGIPGIKVEEVKEPTSRLGIGTY